MCRYINFMNDNAPKFFYDDGTEVNPDLIPNQHDMRLTL